MNDDRREICECVGWHGGGQEHEGEGPEFPVLQGLAEYGPSKFIGDCVATVILDAFFDEGAVFFREKAFGSSFVGEIDDQKPGPNGNDLCEKPFDYLM